MEKTAWEQHGFIADLFGYMKRDREAALELYRALSGTEDGNIGEIELREEEDAYYLTRKGMTTFLFPTEKEK